MPKEGYVARRRQTNRFNGLGRRRRIPTPGNCDPARAHSYICAGYPLMASPAGYPPEGFTQCVAPVKFLVSSLRMASQMTIPSSSVRP